MRFLRAVLWSVYVILLVLVLLGTSKCSSSGHNKDVAETVDPGSSINPVPPVENDSIIKIVDDIGGDGNLKITLLWNFVSDLDLHVMQPNGNELWYGNMRDAATGGYLDVDNIPGGSGSAENVYWENPPAGRYKVWVNYFSKGNPNSIGGNFTVVITKFGHSEVYKLRTTQVKEDVFVAEIEIP